MPPKKFRSIQERKKCLNDWLKEENLSEDMELYDKMLIKENEKTLIKSEKIKGKINSNN